MQRPGPDHTLRGTTLPPLSQDSSTLELARNALADKRLIRVARRRQAKRVARIEAAGTPAGPAKVHVTVAVDEIQTRAHVLLAAGRVAAAHLGDERLALGLAEVVAEGLEAVGDVVGHALLVFAGAVAVVVVVDVVDQVIR